MKRRLLAFAWLGPTLALAGCGSPQAHGDVNALIVAAEPSLWSEVEPDFRDAVSPTIQTVRNEEPFRITFHEPGTAGWENLSRFRQVIAIGDAADPWVAEALAEVEDEEMQEAPAIMQAFNVWARGQQVTILLLPETGQAEAVGQLVGPLHTLLDEQFRTYATNRMFISEPNEALADSLAESVGFSLRLPRVYQHSVRDSVFRFRNDNPSPTELIREVMVTWDSPIPEDMPTARELRVWRDSMVARYYVDAQMVDTTAAVETYRPIEVDGLSGVEYQSAWSSPPGAWIAGGPFILRAIRCPEQNRLYYTDAWLYAPNQDKYEYMIQLQTILDSFRCGTQPDTEPTD